MRLDTQWNFIFVLMNIEYIHLEKIIPDMNEMIGHDRNPFF
jgi:hypothetical protein